MTDVTISEIDEDEKREAALRAEELGERIFNILDGEKSYFVQLNAIAVCLAVMLYGNDDAEPLLQMFGDKVLHRPLIPGPLRGVRALRKPSPESRHSPN